MAKKIWIILLFILVLLISELLYTINTHKINLISAYYVFQAQRSMRKSDLKEALNFLSIGATYNLKEIRKTHKSLIPQNYQLGISLSDNNQKLQQEFGDYIKTIALVPILEGKDDDLSRIFYTLAVKAGRLNEKGIAEKLFQTAIFLYPDLSYYHVELANYRILNGDLKGAQEALDYCLRFLYPQEHCREFMDNNFKNISPESLGFLEKTLEEYYTAKRPR